MSTALRFAIAAFLLLSTPVLSVAQEVAPKRMGLDQVLSRRGMTQFSTHLPRAWQFVEGTNLIHAPDQRRQRPGTDVLSWNVDLATLQRAAKPESVQGPKPLRASMLDALKAAGGEVPASAFEGGPVMSTLPRTPTPHPGFVASDDGNAGLVLHEGKLVLYRRDTKPVISEARFAQARQLSLSANGTTASALLADGNLAVFNANGTLHVLTTDACESIFEGELDWVYQEEVYGRYDFRGSWLSADGSHIAWMRIDEAAVPDFEIVDQVPVTQVIEHLRYPKAGQGNPVATLHVADCVSGKQQAVDLSEYKPEEEILIVRVGWDPAGRLLFMVQNREQQWLDLMRADPTSGKATRLLRENSKTWVNILSMPRFLADGSFLWESERSGYRHVFHYGANGGEGRAITNGEWQVTEIQHVDETRGFMDVAATKDGAINKNLYRVRLNGSGMTRLTEGPGSHDVEFSADRTWLLDTVSSVSQPPEQRLCKDDGSVVKVLEKAAAPAGQADGTMSMPELVQITARDGCVLDARLTRPLWVKPGEKCAVWMQTYAGPDTPTVHNRFQPDLFAQFLAHQGIGVLDINVRTASGRGQAFTQLCYGQFGVQELLDLEDAARWVGSQDWADAGRIGMTGWSYGGYITAYALTHSKLWKVGIAGGGVYQWEDYDTIYTERYMKTPQHNAEGYKTSSVLAAASNLSGHLLILHGLMDDNVHAQNAIQLIYALQGAGKQFDMMLYPQQRHGVSDPRLSRHMRELMWNTIRAKL